MLFALNNGRALFIGSHFVLFIAKESTSFN